jgi:hypothetical protein
VLKKQEQEQRKQQQKLQVEASVLEKQGHEQRIQQQKLIADANLLEKEEQEQKWKQEQQQLDIDTSLLEEQEQKQARRRQKLTLGGKALKEQKEQQKQAEDTSIVREQQDMDKSQLSHRTQRQIEARKNQEPKDRLHKTRTGMGKAQTSAIGQHSTWKFLGVQKIVDRTEAGKSCECRVRRRADVWLPRGESENVQRLLMQPSRPAAQDRMSEP